MGVMAFDFLKSIQNLTDPSFFGISTMGNDHGDLEDLSIPASSIFRTHEIHNFSLLSGIRYGARQMGASDTVLIKCT